MARLEVTGEIVETTALAVFRIPDPFTHYIFVDKDHRCTDALTARIRRIAGDANFTVLTGDANALVTEVVSALPRFGPDRGLLSYCFVDPFAADLKFETIRTLGRLRMDFLILLMLGLDARVNFRTYLADENSSRIAELIDCSSWREEWLREAQQRRPNVIRFLMSKFDQAMTRIGYRPAPLDSALGIRIPQKNVLIYQLVFYSKHTLGEDFWRKTRKGIASQPDLFGDVAES